MKKQEGAHLKVERRPPTFHPISALPMIGSVIDGLLDDIERQYALLTKAKDKPHLLDDDTVDRVIRLYSRSSGGRTDGREMAGVFDEQLSRWQKGALTESLRVEVERLTNSMKTLRKWSHIGAASLYDDILALASDLRKVTIDRILEMSDEEVGLAVLTGKLKPPR